VDFVKALENFQKGASLTTGLELPSALGLIGYTYYNAGFPEKGNDYYLQALKLSGDSVSYSDVSFYHIAQMQGDYKRAIEYYENKYLRDTTNATFFDNLGLWHLFLGQYQEALKCYKKYNSLYGQTNDPHMGYTYLQNGYRKEADYCFDRHIKLFNDPFERSRHPYSIIGADYALALIYASRGDKVKAYKYLKVFDQDQCVDLEFVQFLKNDPVFNSIKNEPEFQKIVRNVDARYQTEHERVRKWLEEQGKM
jgi:tetratricopeptide (TPR) repeat protein